MPRRLRFVCWAKIFLREDYSQSFILKSPFLSKGCSILRHCQVGVGVFPDEDTKTTACQSMEN
jgi:hypothetical protein